MKLPDKKELALFKRSSVRRFSDRQMHEAEVQFVLEAAMAAPSANNRRPWRFIVITQSERLDYFAERLQYGKALKTAKAAIVVCGVPEYQGMQDDHWIQGCSAAIQNMLLALTEVGLGGVWLGIYPRENRMQMIKKACEIPADMIPFAVVAMGQPVNDLFRNREYEVDKVHWNQWDSKQI